MGEGRGNILPLPYFHPRAPWWGGDLQTLRNMIVAANARLEQWPARELVFDTLDGSGDVLSAIIQCPETVLNKPTMLLVHGLTGSAESSILRNSARAFLEAGHVTVRVNLRAAPPIADRCTLLSHAGKTEDLRALLAQLPAELTQNGVLIMGYSLGGNASLKLAGEGDLPRFVRGIVSVSAPIDLYHAQQRIAQTRNRIYHRFLLKGMKEGAQMSRIAQSFKKAADQALNIYEFDDLVVAPLHGFKSATDYYRANSAQHFIPAITCPTLIIHAQDDPWIPARPYHGIAHKVHSDTRIILLRNGGHVGFHGQGSKTTWHDQAALQFGAQFGA